MADKKTDQEKDKDKKDKSGAATPAATPASVETVQPKPPGMIKLFLFVAMPLMMFQAGIAYFLISRYMPAPGAHAQPPRESADSTADHGQETDTSAAAAVAGHGEERKATAEAKATHGDPFQDTPEEKNNRFTHHIKDIIVNPAATAGTRFLNVSFAFDYGREKLKDELEAEDFRLRDAIINLLVTKRIDEIDGADDKELLRQQTLTVVNELLKTGRVRKIYFTNFVIQ
jgi:flagellar basal body-associated protein FliL